MKTVSLLIAVATVALLETTPLRAGSDASQFWPQWRGPLQNGIAPEADPPVQWSETNSVRWKTTIPGYGTSTPIVWGNRVFILTAIDTGKQPSTPPANPGPGAPATIHQFVVLCLDRQDGKIVWQKVAREQVPHEGHHKEHGYASASPVTDGQHVYAYFGSRGLYCYDFKGNLKWEKDFGDMTTRATFGEGASPALSGNKVVIVWDHEGDDFIVALDKTSGKELWRTPRNEPTGWCTPLIVEYGGKSQVIVNATGKVRSYDLETGKQVWEAPGTTQNAIPSATANSEMAFVAGGFRGSALHAIRLGRTGDLTGTDAIAWSYSKDTPYVPSPLVVDGLVYFIKVNTGVLSCLDAKTGTPHFAAQQLDGIRGIYASPVAAKDRVYVLGREGKCVVLKKGPKLEVLATSSIDDKTDASLALAGKDLFIRGYQKVYCITAK